MKRFSKMVSVMTLSPRAVHISTRNCACMSVGKPGWGAVVTFTPRRGPFRRTRTLWPSLAISTPAARIFTTSASMSESSAPSRMTSPPFGDGRRDHVRAGLDAVGDDGVVERRELAALGAPDVDDVGPGAVDLGAHLVEDASELLHLRLARAVDERGPALGERRRHHEVLGAGDRRDVEVHLVAAKPPAAARVPRR